MAFTLWCSRAARCSSKAGSSEELPLTVRRSRSRSPSSPRGDKGWALPPAWAPKARGWSCRGWAEELAAPLPSVPLSAPTTAIAGGRGASPAWSAAGCASWPGPSRALFFHSGGGGVPEVAPLAPPASGPGGDQPVVSISPAGGRGTRPHQGSPSPLQADREVPDVGVLQVLPEPRPPTAKAEQVDNLPDSFAEPSSGPPSLNKQGRCVPAVLVPFPAVEDRVPDAFLLNKLTGLLAAGRALVAHAAVPGLPLAP